MAIGLLVGIEIASLGVDHLNFRFILSLIFFSVAILGMATGFLLRNDRERFFARLPMLTLGMLTGLTMAGIPIGSFVNIFVGMLIFIALTIMTALAIVAGREIYIIIHPSSPRPCAG